MTTGPVTPENAVVSSRPKLGFWQTLYRDVRATSFLNLFYKIIFRPEGLATFLYRASSYFYRKGKIGWVLSMLFWRLNILINVCEIQPITQIGPGFRIFHASGIVFGGGVFGENLDVYQNVTIGENPAKGRAIPKIGDNVRLYAGAVIVGDITIGSDTIIGANAVVTQDIPAHSTVRAPSPEIRTRTSGQ